MPLKSIFALFALTASGQVTVSFSPQGPASMKALTGKKIATMELLSVIACSKETVQIAGGQFYYQALQSGISPIDPKIAEQIVASNVNRNWANIILNAAGYATLLVPVLGQSRAIPMSKAWTAGLLAAHSMADSLPQLLSPYRPDPSVLTRSLIQPDETVTVPRGSCFAGTMAAAPGVRKAALLRLPN